MGVSVVDTTSCTTTAAVSATGASIIVAVPSGNATSMPVESAAAPAPTAGDLDDDPVVDSAAAVDGLLAINPGATVATGFSTITVPTLTSTYSAYPSPSNGSEVTPWGTYVYTEGALALVISYPFICFVLIALAMELNLRRWRRKNLKSKMTMEWP